MKRIVVAAFAILAAFAAVPLAGASRAEASAVSSDVAASRAAGILQQADKVEGQYVQYRRWGRSPRWRRRFYGPRFYGPRFHGPRFYGRPYYGRPFYRPYRPYRYYY